MSRFDPRRDQPAAPPPPDLWPAWLWIALGALIYLGAPQFYSFAAGAAYFILGGCVALAVLGTLTARFNLMMGPILKDLFPAEGLGGALPARALRWLVLGMEGLAVMHLSRLTVLWLAP
jgi:hypothetical protein